MPELFSEPDKFSPERWSKENKDSLPSMFAHLPFGFGARMCVGKFGLDNLIVMILLLNQVVG